MQSFRAGLRSDASLTRAAAEGALGLISASLHAVLQVVSVGGPGG
jgi:hypothetical protein